MQYSYTKGAFCLILSFFLLGKTYASLPLVDSLWQEYHISTDDSLKIETLVYISFNQFHNADSVSFCLEKADSINQQLQNPSLSGKICESYGIMFGWYLDDFGLAKVCFEEAITHFEAAEDEQSLGYALDGLGSMLSEEGASNEGFITYFKAEQQFRLAKDTTGLIMNLCNLGLLSLETGKELGALDYFFESLALSDFNDDPYVRAQILGGIGTAYYSQEKTTKALEFYLKAVKLFRENDEPYSVSVTLSEIAELYAAIDSSELSEANYKEALEIADEMGSPTLLSTIYTSKANAAMEMGLLPKGFEMIEKSMDYLGELKAPNYRFSALMQYGELYLHDKDYKMALQKTQAAIASVNTKNHSQMVEANRQLSKIYEGLGEESVSLMHLKTAQEYQEILDNAEQTERIRFAELNYENYRKDWETQKLKDQKKTQEALIFQQQNDNRFLLLCMLMVVAFLCVSLFAFWKTRKAAQFAEHTAKVKSSFLANMSHEIRTPMNGVLGMTELMESTKLNAEQKDYVSTIRQSSESLLGIINDILDFSKIESGHMDLEQEPIFLRGLIEDTLTLFAAQSTSSGVELLYYIDPSLPFGFIGDELRIKQILSNLISNALKFTRDGYVAVKVFSYTPANEKGRFSLGFTIEDTGIGIPAEKQAGLFDAFTQADSSTTRKYGGTGLGLTISKRLTSLMKGEIWVESEINQGSSFSFSLETEACSPPVDMSKMIQIPAGKSVVLISDLKVRQDMLRDWFSFREIEVQIFSNIDQVIGIDLPDVIILDDRVRSQNAWQNFVDWKQNCPLILLINTGLELPEAVKSEAQNVIHKPVKCHIMGQAMKEGLNWKEDLVSVPALVPNASLTKRFAEQYPLNILVAEDNLVNQKLIIRVLEKLGYQVQIVSNGQDAVSAVYKTHYDLVLMDIHMPIMDGLAATQEIIKNLPTDKVPRIVALTANAMNGDREMYLANGMDAYLSKPFKQDEIKKVLVETATAKVMV
ncbi:MAG: ATP-binding protein [Bacteroidia bacterium]